MVKSNMAKIPTTEITIHTALAVLCFIQIKLQDLKIMKLKIFENLSF